LRLGAITLDLERRRFARGTDGWTPIEGLSFRLLEVLVAAAPRPVSKRELLREVWGDVAVDPATLTQRVRLLRRTLDDPACVAAVKGYGYRLGRRPVALDSRPSGRLRFVQAALVLLATGAVGVWLAGPGHAVVHATRHLLAR
jgi:DNA-binding winged helix-turn-helix (wHTH) protein